MNERMNESVTKLFVEQPWLHRVCEQLTSAAEVRRKADEIKGVEENPDKLFDIVQCTHPIFTCQQGGLLPPCVPANCSKKFT